MDTVENHVADAATDAEKMVANTVDVAKTMGKPAKGIKFRPVQTETALPAMLDETVLADAVDTATVMADAAAADTFETVAEATEATMKTTAATDASATDATNLLRGFAEDTVRRARAGYDTARTAAEGATDALEETIETARTGALDLGMKLIELAHANTEATFTFARKVMGVRSLSEAVELQTAFARQQFDAVTTQAREFRELAGKIAAETAVPVRQALAKTRTLDAA